MLLNSRVKVLCIILVTLLFVVFPLISGCAPKEAAPAAPSAKPTEPKVLKAASILDHSGPLSSATLVQFHGWMAWIKGFNEAGGYKGVTIEPLWEDDEYKVEKAKTAYARFIPDPRCLTIFTTGGATSEAVWAMAKKDHIVHLPTYVEPMTVYEDSWSFGSGYQTGAGLANLLQWIDKHPDALGIKPPLKVAGMWAELSWGIQDSKTANKLAPKFGINFVANEVIPYTPSDLTAALLRIKQSGANLVIIETSPTAIARIVKDGTGLGVFPGAKVVIAPAYTGRGTASLLPQEEAWSFCPVALYRTPWNSETKKLADLVMKYYGGKYTVADLENEQQFGYGAISAELAIRAYKKALDEIGYEALQGATGREAVYKAVKTLNFEPGFYGRINFATNYPDWRAGCHTVYPVHLTGGKWKPIGDWFEIPGYTAEEVDYTPKK